jgi:PilZ domain
MAQRKKADKAMATVSDDDRRANPRLDATKLGPVVARLIGGSEVRLIDFSRHGVLVESDVRLQIGAKASIKITTTDGALVVRGSVVRSRVSGVVGSNLTYHTALALEEDLAKLEEVMVQREPVAGPTREVAVPDAMAAAEALDASAHSDAVAGAGQGPAPSAGSEHAYSPGADASPDAAPDPVFEFLATVPLNLVELRRRAAVNNW